MSELHTIGLKSVKVGAIAADGGMGTTLAALADTFEGSATLVQEDGEKTSFFVEESEDAVEIITKKGETKFSFSIIDFTPATLAAVLGGEATGVGDAAVWKAPSGSVTIEKSIEIISTKNVKFQIPRAKIEAKIDVTFSKKEIGKVIIVATVLTPTKAAEPSIMVSKAV